MANPVAALRTRTARSLVFGVAGQSNAAHFLQNPVGAEFIKQLRLIGADTNALPNSVEMVVWAAGGTYASLTSRLLAEADAGTPADVIAAIESGSDATQCDDRNPASLADGQLVTDAKFYVSSYAANPVQHIFMDHGQTEGVKANTLDPVGFAQRWYAAWVYALAQYRGLCANGNTASTKVGIQIMGRVYPARGLLGTDRIRQKQLQLIDNVAGMFKAAECWDLELREAAHIAWTSNGQFEEARRIAEGFAKNVLGINSYTVTNADESVTTITLRDGPSISSVTKVDATHVQVVINGNGESVTYPTTVPCCFRFGDSASDFDQIFASAAAVPVQEPIAMSRSGNTLTFTLATPIPNTPVLFFPFDDGVGFDPAKVIRGATSLKPLQSWKR